MSAGLIVPCFSVSNVEIGAIINQIGADFDDIVFVMNGYVGRHGSMQVDGDKVHYLVHDELLGKSEAVRGGLRWMLAREHDVYVQLDGHGKQPVEQVRRLVALVAGKRAGLAVANRYEYRPPRDRHRQALTILMSRMVETVTEIKLLDTVCGMRAYNKELAHFVLSEGCSLGYGLEVEQLIIAARHGFVVRSVGVTGLSQAENTAAEKLIDNFTTIIWACKGSLNVRQNCGLHALVAALKNRVNYRLVGEHWGIEQDILFRFVGKDFDGEDAYSLTSSDSGISLNSD